MTPTHRREDDAAPAALRPVNDGVGDLGLRLFLASLAVLFGAGVVAYLVVRSRAVDWPPPGAPGLPRGIWVSTGLLLSTEWLVHLGLLAIRRGRAVGSQRALTFAMVGSLAFVASQAANWLWFANRDTTFESHLYAFTFYMLTGLHALHVLGGVGQLGYVLRGSIAGRHSWAQHSAIRHCATYWHFLGGVWLVLMLLLWLDA